MVVRWFFCSSTLLLLWKRSFNWNISLNYFPYRSYCILSARSSSPHPLFLSLFHSLSLFLFSIFSVFYVCFNFIFSSYLHFFVRINRFFFLFSVRLYNHSSTSSLYVLKLEKNASKKQNQLPMHALREMKKKIKRSTRCAMK